MAKFLDKTGLDTFWAKIKSTFQTLGNLVTAWGSTPSDSKYPSEKLVKNNLDSKLDKLTYEWNKEISFGSTGYLCIGKFPMYDSNVTITISSTTRVGFSGTIVIATQNINTSRGGTYAVNVYGDPDGDLSSILKVKYSSGSVNFEVYIDFPPWSKNLIHIQAQSLKAAPTDIATSVESIPDTDLLTVTNKLDAKQDALATQTAYSAKGSATKVPQITTNTLGQVTGITEVTISGVTPASHTHGNIQNGGTLQTNDVTIANGDKLVVTDASDSNKIARSSVAFDGSTVGKSLSQKGTWEYPKEAYLEWGGKNFTNGFGPLDAALISDLGANRFAGGMSNGITIEYTRDGGTTWIDYGATNLQKRNLFTCKDFSIVVGQADSTHPATTAENYANYKVRVIVDCQLFYIYTAIKKFCFYVSTGGSSQCYVKLSGVAKAATTDTWTDIAEMELRGWSGYNVLNKSLVIGQATGPNTQYKKLCFLFECRSAGNTNYTGLRISNISGYGGVGWTIPSHLASIGHLYSYNGALEATFPAKVTATSFDGKFATARKLAVSLSNTSTDTSFDGSADVTNIKTTGTLGIANGGTGKTTATAARNALLSGMTAETNDIDNNSEVVFKYVGPTDNNGAVYSRKVTKVWNYVKSKISSVLGLTETSYGGNAATATTATNYASGGGIENALAGKQDKTGDASNTTATFTKNASDTSSMASGSKLSALFTAISSFFASLKALAFKDKASYSDLSSGVQSSLDKADSALQFAVEYVTTSSTWQTLETAYNAGKTLILKVENGTNWFDEYRITAVNKSSGSDRFIFCGFPATVNLDSGSVKSLEVTEWICYLDGSTTRWINSPTVNGVELTTKGYVDRKSSKPSTFSNGNLAALDTNGNLLDAGVSASSVASVVQYFPGKQDAVTYQEKSSTDETWYHVLMPDTNPTGGSGLEDLGIYGGLLYQPKTGNLTCDITGKSAYAGYADNYSTGGAIDTALGGKMATDGSNAAAAAPTNILNKLSSASQQVDTGYSVPVRYDSGVNQTWYYATVGSLAIAIKYDFGWDGTSTIGGSYRPIFLNSQGKFAQCSASIPTSPGDIGAASEGHNHDSSYVSSVSFNGYYLRVTKNGINTDITVPYASETANANQAYRAYPFNTYVGLCNASSSRYWCVHKRSSLADKDYAQGVFTVFIRTSGNAFKSYNVSFIVYRSGTSWSGKISKQTVGDSDGAVSVTFNLYRDASSSSTAFGIYAEISCTAARYISGYTAKTCVEWMDTPTSNNTGDTATSATGVQVSTISSS